MKYKIFFSIAFLYLILIHPVKASSVESFVPIETNFGFISNPANMAFNYNFYYTPKIQSFEIKVPKTDMAITIPPLIWKSGFGRWSGTKNVETVSDFYLSTGLQCPVYLLIDEIRLFVYTAYSVHIVSAEYKTSDNEYKTIKVRSGPRLAFGGEYNLLPGLDCGISMGFDIVARTNTFFMNTNIRYNVPIKILNSGNKFFSFFGLQ